MVVVVVAVVVAITVAVAAILLSFILVQKTEGVCVNLTSSFQKHLTSPGILLVQDSVVAAAKDLQRGDWAKAFAGAWSATKLLTGTPKGTLKRTVAASFVAGVQPDASAGLLSRLESGQVQGFAIRHRFRKKSGSLGLVGRDDRCKAWRLQLSGGHGTSCRCPLMTRRDKQTCCVFSYTLQKWAKQKLTKRTSQQDPQRWPDSLFSPGGMQYYGDCFPKFAKESRSVNASKPRISLDPFVASSCLSYRSSRSTQADLSQGSA